MAVSTTDSRNAGAVGLDSGLMLMICTPNDVIASLLQVPGINSSSTSPLHTSVTRQCHAPIQAKASCALEAKATGQCRPLACKGASYSSQALLDRHPSPLGGNKIDTVLLQAHLSKLDLLSPSDHNRFLCSPLDHALDSSPHALLASRGVCPFGSKARIAQDTAAALLLIDDSSPSSTGPLVAPSFEQDPDVTIPAAMIGGRQSLGDEGGEEDDDDDLWRTGQGWHLSMNVSVTLDELSLGFLQEGKKLLAATGKQQEAHVCLQAAVESKPDNLEAHYALANFYSHHRHVEGAYWHYMQALRLDKDHLPSLTNLPTLLYKYDIPGLSTPAKETSFQYHRCRAQEVVVRELGGLDAFNRSCPGSQGLRLVRDWKGEEGAGVDMVRLFPAEGAECQMYGTDSPLVVEEDDLDDFPLNPMDTDPWDNLEYTEKEVYIVTFRGGVHVSGDPAIIHRGCEVFIPSPGCVVPLHSLLDAPPRPHHYHHRVLLAHQMSCDNYYHWTMECLPRLLLLLDYLVTQGEGPSTSTTLVLPSGCGGGRKFVDDSLAEISSRSAPHAALLQSLEVVYYEPLEGSFTAEEVMTVDWRAVDARPGTELFPARAALQRLREFFLGDAVVAEGPKDLLIWISRNQDRLSGRSSRRVVNEEAMLESLHELVDEWNAGGRGRPVDVAVFHGDSMSLEDTVGMFSRAVMVMGLHGAGLANMVYCPPHTHVVEVALKTPRHRDYAHAAMALGHHYWVILGPDNALESEVVLDEDKVLETVSKVLEMDFDKR